MSLKSRPLWFEGMFMRPQHLQQYDRYLEAAIELRAGQLTPFAWGLLHYEFDAQLLRLGRLALVRCQAVLPDGTPVDVPELATVPPREVSPTARGALVHLALPLRPRDGIEVAPTLEAMPNARFTVGEINVRDSTKPDETGVALRVLRPSLRLMLDGEPRDEFLALPLARILEVTPDGQLALDQDYVPPLLDCQADARVVQLMREIEALLRGRGEALATRIDPQARGASVVDLMMLQLVNRWEGVFGHLAELRGLHPERLFASALALVGELATFSIDRRRPRPRPQYRHDDLGASLLPLVGEIRASLSMVIEEPAIAIPLQQRPYGVWVAQIADRTILAGCRLIFAVTAEIPAETVRQKFPTQVKCGPVESLRDLVNLQLPGIPLRPTPVAPREVPYHAGATYFELDQQSELWPKLATSPAFAFHISGDYPGLALEFWAIRGAMP